LSFLLLLILLERRTKEEQNKWCEYAGPAPQEAAVVICYGKWNVRMIRLTHFIIILILIWWRREEWGLVSFEGIRFFFIVRQHRFRRYRGTPLFGWWFL
jgi:hypothetical protein